MGEARYILVSDDSGHSFYIPQEREQDWEDFMADPKSIYEDCPEWACRIDGSFSFSDPRCS